MRAMSEYYPRGSRLWFDGLAYQHYRIMFQLGYGNKLQKCPCEDCKRAERMMDEAHKLNKKPLSRWFSRR